MWLPLDPAWTLVTDASAPEETLAAFAAGGVRVLTAG